MKHAIAAVVSAGLLVPLLGAGDEAVAQTSWERGLIQEPYRPPVVPYRRLPDLPRLRLLPERMTAHERRSLINATRAAADRDLDQEVLATWTNIRGTKSVAIRAHPQQPASELLADPKVRAAIVRFVEQEDRAGAQAREHDGLPLLMDAKPDTRCRRVALKLTVKDRKEQAESLTILCRSTSADWLPAVALAEDGP